MATTTTTTTTTTQPKPSYPPQAQLGGVLKLRGGVTEPVTGAFPQLDTEGYTVVKNVLSRERAQHYVDEIYAWLESFGRGFKGDDRSTWHVDQLPTFSRGGLFHRYGAGHEQFAWDIRAEPALIDVFARIWGTDELLVSFDSVNCSLPFPVDELKERSGAWPHVDQSPGRRFKHCVQGIMNLYENGPLDGGLQVLAGSMPLYDAFFDAHPELKPEDGWWDVDWFMHEAAYLDWFYARGCKWIKVEAGPGDVILWDSRTIHYGDVAKGDRPRVATYVCYKPARDITPEKLALRKECFENSWSTSHDPLNFRVVSAHTGRWTLEEGESDQPRKPPVLSVRAKKLAGLVPY
ncbi:hypothetical protein Q5752_004447 [Cryptotrichosporon argae]